MRLTTIGSGTGAPSPSRVSSAHVLEVAGQRILLDCGSGSVHRMAALGIDWMGITHCVFSHFHADHISDIPTLLYAWRYGSLPPRSAPVELIGPTGFTAMFEAYDALFGGEMRQLGFPVHILELAPGETRDLASGVSLTSYKVNHNAESVAWSVSSSSRRFVYTGDTPLDLSLAAWAHRCDLLLTECSLPSSMAVKSHMTPEQCAEFAVAAQPAALALTHFYAPLDGMDVAAIVAEAYDGPVHITFDGWTTVLGD